MLPRCGYHQHSPLWQRRLQPCTCAASCSSANLSYSHFIDHRLLTLKMHPVTHQKQKTICRKDKRFCKSNLDPLGSQEHVTGKEGLCYRCSDSRELQPFAVERGRRPPLGGGRVESQRCSRYHSSLACCCCKGARGAEAALERHVSCHAISTSLAPPLIIRQHPARGSTASQQ